MRADIVPGGTFPDYELTDHAKTRRKLSELQGIDPMILLLSRGSFCPKDHQQHLELAANYPKIKVSYTQIVTISTYNIARPTSSATRWAPSGRSCPTRAATSRRTWTSRSTPTPTTTR
jgi:peroxiredoxin